MSGLEPFFDYDSLSDERALAVREAVVASRKAQDDLISAHTADSQVACAKRFLELQMNISKLVAKIHNDIHTIPSIVHIAGAVQEEHDSNGYSIYSQRCDRCGSMLSMAATDDPEKHFAPGDVVGKLALKDKQKKRSGRHEMNMYFVGERDLQPHEYECVSLREVFEEMQAEE